LNSGKLSNIRKGKKITQVTLAKRMGMSTKTYNRKELGLIDFTRHEIESISKELSLTIEDVNEIFFNNNITNR
jgi:transcriptional regulator with XRE-family HTH domain